MGILNEMTPEAKQHDSSQIRPYDSSACFHILVTPLSFVF